MHVLHLIDGLALGGAERMLVELANRTVADGHRVSVCVTRHDATRGRELDPRIRLLVLDRRRRLAPAKSLRLARWIRAERVDVIHAHMRSSAAFAAALRALGLVSRPIVFHDHFGGIDADRSVPAWFRLGHRFLTEYVGVNDTLCAWARDAGVPAGRATTIRNGLDLARLRAGAPGDVRGEFGVDPATPLGVLVATVRRDKAIEVLIDALDQSRHRDRIRVVVAGSFGDRAYLEDCRQRIARHGLDRTLAFLGPRTDVPALLRAADFGLLSSRTESGPLVLLEYLCAGLPIVATEVGEVGRRLAELGIPGFVPHSDPQAFAHALDTLLELSPAERRARGQRGLGNVTGEWDIATAMPRWYEVYHRALAR